MRTALQDLRYAFRTMLANPSFTLVAVLCLALGMGANSTVFGIIDALFFQPPPGVGDPAAIVRPYFTRRTGAITEMASDGSSYPDYVALGDAAHALSGFAAFTNRTFSIGRGTAAERASAMLTSVNYFSVLHVRPALGRFFTRDEGAGPGSPPAAVISYAFWQQHFGGDRAVLGKTLLVQGYTVPVVGVAPPDFRGVDVDAVDVWLPFSQALHVGMHATELTTPYTNEFRMIGRLAPGATRELAQAQMVDALRHAASAHTDLDQHPELTLGPALSARGPALADEARIARWLALAAVLVLAVACANIANLLIARAAVRRKEIAIRLSMGASRRRVVRQLLTESALLAFMGAAVGLLIALWGIDLVPSAGLPPLHFFAHGRMLAFITAAAVLCAVLFGLVPALWATRTDLALVLREGAREGVDRRSRVRSTLMVAQLALAVVLLAGAGLFVHSLGNIESVHPGIDVDHLLEIRIDLSATNYTATMASALFDQAEERVRAVPGVANAALAQGAQLAGGISMISYTIPDRDGNAPARTSIGADGDMGQTRTATYPVDDRYFATVGTPIVRGRQFTSADRSAGGHVAIVNQTFARREWPRTGALGKCIDIGGGSKPGERGTCYTVIGVAADAKYMNLEESPRSAYFIPLGGETSASVLLARTTGSAHDMIPAIRNAVASLAPDLPYVDVQPMTDVLRPQLRVHELGAAMFGIFGLLALVLATVGLYGVVAYTVEQRTREIGIRVALGAQQRDALLLIFRQSALLATIGLAIGLAGALETGRLVQHLLFGVRAVDAPTLAGVVVLLGAATLLASWVPARRAARVDPMVALRRD